MNVKEWAEKNRKTPPYLKSVINRVQDDKVERVVIKKTFKVSETIELIDKRVYNKACLDLLLNGESFELKKADGIKERIDPSRVTKTIAVDVQKDGLVISKFNNQEFLVKNESSGVFPDSFYVSDLGIPWEDPKINLEEKFQKDFNKNISGKILVDDISQLPISMLGKAVDRISIKTWVDQWILSHGDLDENFKLITNEFLENQFKRPL